MSAGDEIYLLDGTVTYVTDSELEQLPETIKVYNLEVADFNTYFVGDEAVLVHNYETTTPEDVSAFGNSPNGNNPGPRSPRADRDFEVSSGTSIVGGNTDHGASTFIDPKKSGLNGHYWTLPSGTKLPDGLGFFADGADVIPGSPHKAGHRTIFPVSEMTLDEFIDLFKSLPWECGGKVW